MLRSIPALGVLGSIKLLLAFTTRLSFNIRPKGYKHSVLVRGMTSDPRLVFTIFARNGYPIIADPDIRLIIDAGANAGYASVYFAHNYPNAKIIAVEPEHSNFAMLKRNTQVYPNVTALESGLWWRNANVEVVDSSSEKWCFQFTETCSGGIPCTTMEGLIRKHYESGKVFAKIDIEGAECDIFERDPSWLDLVDYISVEIHYRWKSVFDALSKKNYEARISGEDMFIELEKSKAHQHDSGFSETHALV